MILYPQDSDPGLPAGVLSHELEVNIIITQDYFRTALDRGNTPAVQPFLSISNA